MTVKPLAPRELWFVAGSQELYGEEVLALVEAQSRELVAALDEAQTVPVRVIHRAVVKGAEEIRRVCLEANAADDCVGVIAWMHTFSPAKMWIGGLGALQKPLLHLHTQFNAALPWSTIDMDFMNLNQSAHGDREFAHLAARMRLRHRTVVGHWRDATTLARIGTWSRAACGWQESQRLRVARFGDNMRQVAVTDGDKVEAQLRFGFTVDGYGVGDLAAALEDAAPEEVERVLGECEDAYDLTPELRRDGERRDALVYAARIEVALGTFLGERGYHAFGPDVAEETDLPALVIGDRHAGPAQEHIRLNADRPQLLDGVLRRLGFQLPRSLDVGDERQMHEGDALASQIVAELPDRLEERKAFDIADSTSDLDEKKINLGHARKDEILDRIGDMRNDLNGAPEIAAAPFGRDHFLIDASGRYIVGPAR